MRLTGKGKDKKNTAEVKREKRTESRKETNIMREEDRERCREWEKKKAMTELHRRVREREGGGGCGRLSRTGTAQISHPSGAK